MSGNEGADRADYGRSLARVQVDLGTGRATGEGTDTLSKIEDATGSRLVDTISGSSGNNDLEGNDTISGRQGDDTISGNPGDDDMYGDEDADRVDYSVPSHPIEHFSADRASLQGTRSVQSSVFYPTIG